MTCPSPVTKTADDEVGAALALRNAHLLENINALLLLVGDLKPCKSCGRAVYMVHRPTTWEPRPYDPDGTNHRQTCPKNEPVRADGLARGAR